MNKKNIILLACSMFCSSNSGCSSPSNEGFAPGHENAEASLLVAKMFATNNPSRFAFLKACRPVDESSSLNSPSGTSSDSSTRAINDEEIQGVISRMSGDYSSSSQDEKNKQAMSQARKLVAEMFRYKKSDSKMSQARELLAEMFQVQNPS